MSNWHKADPNVAHFLTLQAGRNSMVSGPPGVAKSQSHIQLAERTGRELILLLGSTMAPEDVGGIPHVMSAESFFRQLPPYWAERLQRPGVLVLADEFTTVSPSVRAPLQTMYSDRRIGQCHIHPDNWLAAACNPPRWAPNASPLEKAMANRFAHFEWTASFEGFCDGMESAEDKFTSGWIPTLDATPDPDSGLPSWFHVKPKWGFLITGYLRKNASDRSQIPANDEEVSFPTYRSWHFLRDMLAAAESVDAPPNVLASMASAAVGRTAGSNFMRYVATLDLVDPEAVLEGTAKFEYDHNRVDLAAALLVSLVSCVRQRYTTARHEAAIDIFCNNVGKHAKDLVFTQLRALANARPEGTTLSKTALTTITEFGKGLEAVAQKKS